MGGAGLRGARTERRCAGVVDGAGCAGGEMGTGGDDVVAAFEVRGEHAVVSGEMGAGAWHEGGEAGGDICVPR